MTDGIGRYCYTEFCAAARNNLRSSSFIGHEQILQILAVFRTVQRSE